MNDLCIHPDRLSAMALDIQNRLPDHCGFILVVMPLGPQISKTAYVSNIAVDSAIAHMRDCANGLEAQQQ